MISEKGGSRWQLAFWVVSVLCLGAYGAYGYTNYVGEKLVCSIVANDRIRENGDRNIRTEIMDRLEPKLDAMQRDVEEIKVSIARIK